MKRWLGIAVLALAGCQTPPPPLPYPPQRIFQNSYSFMPPAELGWRVVGRNAHQVLFFREGINSDEAFTIQGSPQRLEEYGSREEFFQIIKKRLEKEAADPSYKVLRHDMIAETAMGTSCVRSHFEAEYYAAVKRTATPGVMILEAMARYCVHPKNPNLAVRLGYSHKRYPQHADAGFAEKADRLFSSLEFLE